MDILSPNQVAVLKKCHPATVRTAISAGRLKAKKLGQAYIIKRKDADSWTPQDGPGKPRKKIGKVS